MVTKKKAAVKESQPPANGLAELRAEMSQLSKLVIIQDAELKELKGRVGELEHREHLRQNPPRPLSRLEQKLLSRGEFHAK